MRLPRKVKIGSRNYKVKRRPDWGEGTGRGNTSHRLIQIGSRYGQPDIAFETYVHEITELVMLENGLRFNRDTGDDFFYQIHHHELDRITSTVANAIYPIIK